MGPVPPSPGGPIDLVGDGDGRLLGRCHGRCRALRPPRRSSSVASKELIMDITHVIDSPLHFEVWFESLYHAGRGMVFPCDQAGHVDVDALSERGRNNYFFARAMMGREYANPRIVSCGSRAH